jgi:hypothetical protein
MPGGRRSLAQSLGALRALPAPAALASAVMITLIVAGDLFFLAAVAAIRCVREIAIGRLEVPLDENNGGGFKYAVN